MSSQSIPTFAPANRAARCTLVLLAANVVVSVVALVAGFRRNELLVRVATGAVSEAEAAAKDSSGPVIRMVQLALGLGIIVAFLMWFYRVHRNLRALGGRDLKYTPGWAVGGFFVPFLNFVRPLQVMRETWHGSDPARLERDVTLGGPILRNHLGTPSLVRWWWGMSLASTLIAGCSARGALDPHPTIHDRQVLSSISVVSEALDIPRAIVAMCLVALITRRQARRRDRMPLAGYQTPVDPADELGWGSDETVAPPDSQR